MVLSRVIVDPFYGAGFAVTSDIYQSHRFVAAACGNTPGERPLFRVEPGTCPYLLVQSKTKPDWAKALELMKVRGTFEAKALNLERLKNGRRLAYRLLANPVKMIRDEKGRTDSRGQPKRIRVPLVSDYAQRAWLQRKGEKLGVKWEKITVAGTATRMGHKPRKLAGVQPRIRIDGVLFEEVLMLSDPDQFSVELLRGVGPAKGFGFGLLSVAPYDYGGL